MQRFPPILLDPATLALLGDCLAVARVPDALATLRRHGLRSRRIRPSHPVRGKGEIETEALGIMAKDMGLECRGRPDLEIFHAEV